MSISKKKIEILDSKKDNKRKRKWGGVCSLIINVLIIKINY